MAATPMAVWTSSFCHTGSALPISFFKNPLISFKRMRRLLPSASTAKVGKGNHPSSRRSGNYPPSPWIPLLNSLQNSSAEQSDEISRRILIVREKVVKLFSELSKESSTTLMMLVDTVQQLGLSYHFEEEIKCALDQISNNMLALIQEGDLHTISLLFRLLRDNGYNISQDVFGKFLNMDGEFPNQINQSIKALLNLLEATYYGYEGEDILDKAKSFATSSLVNILEKEDQLPNKDKIVYTLDVPIRQRMIMLHARWFINVYSQQQGNHPEVLELAKLNFQRVQHVYQSDLKEIYSWWKKLGLSTKMPYARDRIMELYFLVAGTVIEPQLSYCRIHVTKALILLTVLDDMFDIYATLEELQLFTEVVERWDLINAMEQLPDHMKICFLAIFNTSNELNYELFRDKGITMVEYFQKMWATQCKSYLLEAKWYNENYIPPLEEYVENGLISVGGPLFAGHLYLILNRDVQNILLDTIIAGKLEISRWCSIHHRLVDDLGTTKHESARGDVAKIVECYMNEKHVSEETAHANIHNIVRQCWKKMNRERFRNPNLSKQFVDAHSNSSCTLQVVYGYGDGVGFPHEFIKEQIMSLFVKPIL